MKNLRRNNLIDITAIDYVYENGLVDFQYSQNFHRYGDIRLDFISAYEPIVDDYRTQIIKDHRNIGKFIKIQKPGKIFCDHLNWIVYYVFGGTSIYKDPDQIILLDVEKVRKLVVRNSGFFVRKIKFNHKNGLGDTHGSSFLPVKLYEIKGCYRTLR